MATILNLTSFDAALKIKYSDKAIKNMVYQNNPLLALVSKQENLGGKSLIIPVRYGGPQGRSATFTTAGTNKYASSVTAFNVTRVSNYGRADIDNETLEASMGDAHAFMQAAAFEIDGVMESIGRDLASDLYHSGSGARARVGTNSSGVITLSNINDIVNFEVGMKLVCTVTEYKSTFTGTAATITAIDRDLGKISLTNANATWVAGRWLHVQGDQSGGPASLKKIVGLSGWLPGTAPGSTAFFGVDRTADVTRLGGLRVDGTGQTVEEALIKGAAALWREGGRPTHVFLNPSHEADLDKVLSGRMRYDSVKAYDADISFESIKLRTGGGTVQVVADPNCPTGVAYLLELSSFALGSLGPAPKILQTDGLRVLRNSGTDSVEVRCGYYGAFYTNAPGHNARISLDT